MAIVQITVYHTTYGNITKPGIGVEEGEEADACGVDEAWVEGYIDDATHYIDPVTFDPTPLKDFADEITVTGGTSITGIPNDTRAFYYNTDSVISDGILDFTGLSEMIDVRLTHVIYLPYSLVLECVSA